MATFFANLWDSVFTPGTTPALLLAANAAFAALQFTLAALLIATYSIHFVILSFLCGGLWWSINWFASELRMAQEKEEEAEKLRKQGKEGQIAGHGEGEGEADDEGPGTDTEVEERRAEQDTVERPTVARLPTDLPVYDPTPADARMRDEVLQSLRKSGDATSSGASSSLRPRQSEHMRQRSAGDLSGEVSTDSEWEKVDEER
ncbi:hypothetical protein LTR50_004805 [Elasticomyces elasticus]|nr:hypothetical protein LTR50_004805 [Elasticomyces elasticus]